MSTHRFRRQLDAAEQYAAEAADAGSYCPDGLTEAAIDALLQDVYRELDSDEIAAEAAFRCDFTDQRRASRSRRRAGRTVLRTLPTRVQAAAIEGEAA